MRKIVVLLSALALVRAQIPNMGWCPEYIPMTNFDMSKFLGIWYEAERYFQLYQLGSRCVRTNYTIGPDGKYHVSNEITNFATGIKRVWDGEIKPPTNKVEEGKLHVKYVGLPLSPEYKYSVLDTDYDSYAVLWNCYNFGLINGQSAWIMTREPFASGEILQKAYAILDKYKISKSFFVKTRQDDCNYIANPAVKPIQQEQPSKDDVQDTEKEPVNDSSSANTRNIEKVETDTTKHEDSSKQPIEIKKSESVEEKVEPAPITK
ncbi:apolipoprotein D-like [Leptopilina heterotoma]|uniref:apolipoprotein D-like n=1 Tax=Leptopilina heterotoma TaxID=63436 RepID=UPI001CA8DAEF|nr:apolipoprotein D-like [Leptopilina heterotoma]